jgi:internalin A
MRNLSPLKGLTKLQQLSICLTAVSDLSPLKDLVNLEYLDISNTAVSDLSPLKGLIKKGIEVIWKSGYD